jgi:hypothetical protein
MRRSTTFRASVRDLLVCFVKCACGRATTTITDDGARQPGIVPVPRIIAGAEAARMEVASSDNVVNAMQFGQAMMPAHSSVVCQSRLRGEMALMAAGPHSSAAVSILTPRGQPHAEEMQQDSILCHYMSPPDRPMELQSDNNVA